MLCVVCHQRPAAIPDRNRMGRPIKRVCRPCHAERLTGDLKEALRLHMLKQMTPELVLPEVK